MDVGISDDYAILSAGGYMFYYGYEETDDEGNWRFVVKEKGEITYDCLGSDLLRYCIGDSPGEVLLAGMGRFIDLNGFRNEVDQKQLYRRR